jgi:methionyl-tRNA formyltransferase
VWAAAPVEVDVPPGRIEVVADGVVMGTGDGALRLDQVQPAGKRRLDAAAWMRGRRNEPAHVGT